MQVDNRARLLLSVILATLCSALSPDVLCGQAPSASVAAETLKARGLELKQNLLIGNYHLALQDLVHMQLALIGSPKAAGAAARTDAMARRTPAVNELEPSLTAPLVPLADKLLQSIDENDTGSLGEQIQQLINKTGTIFSEVRIRDKASLTGTQLGAYFDLEKQLKLSLQSNDTAKSVDLALELQSMMDEFKSRGETVGQRVGNNYMINDALGRAAFFRQDYKTAAEYLMKAVDPPPGKNVEGPICCFGPNLWLAKSLLRAGYRDDVLRFLQACRKSVWISDTEMLDQWIADLISGNTPKFERNADLHF